MDLNYWSLRTSSKRGGEGVKGEVGGRSLFQPDTSFSLLEYKIIWCKIQVIIIRDLKQGVREGTMDRIFNF